MLAYLLAALAAGLLIALFLWYEDNALQITHLEVDCQRGEELRVVHLSDLHGKRFGRKNRRLIAKIDALQPDLLVFTGDLVNDDRDDWRAFAALLGELGDKCPVCYVPGNHEHRYALDGRINQRLRELGVHVLADALLTLTIKGKPVHLLGLDENQGSKEDYQQQRKGRYQYRDSGLLLRQLERKEGTRLVLSHYPENFALTGACAYRQYDFDVMFSGHAHGGQIILPFVGGLYAPGQGVLPRYYRGVYGKRPYLVVSRGMGNSSFPFRVLNRPEVVVVKIF